VFISYASQDAAVAYSVVEALERQGIRCWIAPRDVVPGEFYADAIVHAIDAAKALVLVLSEHAAISHHILREVERASSKRHPVISLRIDRAVLPAGLEYFLNTSQWLDASEGELSHALPKLGEAVRKVLAGAQTTSGGNASASMPPLESMRGPKRRSRGPIAVVLGFIVVAILGFAIDKWWFSRHMAEKKPVAAAAPAAPVSAPIPEKSVAVLPFVDMSEKKDQEYFSDGLSEELIDMLTKVSDLRVPARTSSFYFKGKQTKISDLAKELGVANLLEGSVRKSGKTLRVTAQLIRADNGYHLWSETYDRQLDDIFKVQDEIAGAVVKALKVSLLGVAVTRTAPTTSAASYSLLLQARLFLLRTPEEDQRKALDYYEQVVRLDPTSASAWAGVSRATVNLCSFGVIGWQEGRERALQAAERAVELNPALSDAHIALGKVYMNLDQNFAAAKQEFTRALVQEPHSSINLYWMAAVSTSANDLPQALSLYEQSIAEDPLDSEAYFAMGEAQGFAGHYEEAEASFRRAIDLYPANPWVHGALGIALLNQHKTEAALEAIARESDEGNREVTLAWTYQTLGKTEEAHSALAKLETTRADTDAYAIATVYALRSDVDHVFAWLDRAYRQHEYIMYLKVEPSFKAIRGDPRYRALLRKLNLPE
jgi:TolB-like protein/tetratricopeptide (TPR) repeat protein